MNEPPRLTIGDYELYSVRSYDGGEAIWISHKTGEGGEFEIKLLAKTIDAFYKKHF